MQEPFKFPSKTDPARTYIFGYDFNDTRRTYYKMRSVPVFSGFLDLGQTFIRPQPNSALPTTSIGSSYIDTYRCTNEE